ncbi:hypothetical protein ABTY59_37335 [Streptomyces sp. NPDC096079]|uniref:hypothetical protein n=1 Tax=Streptomyces sp. NPDC096079 TaxID=3155820 RepID=UPI0033201BC8
MADDIDEQAPHGRDENGTPYAPYGYKANGDPKLSNRGRPAANAGPKVAAPPKKAGAPAAKSAAKTSSAKKGRSEEETRGMLLGLAQMVITPLAAAGVNPAVRKRIGNRQGDALAGDAVILHAAAPGLVDGVMAYAKHKPGVLAWMDKAEDLAPSFLLIQELGKLGAALAKNHMAPDQSLAAGARSLVNVAALQHARALREMEAELLAMAEVEAEEIARRTEALGEAVPDLQVA